MESRIKLLGHPVHPMHIVYPLGLLPAPVLFDILYLLTGTADFATVAFWLIIVGVVGGLLAALFGLIDWLSIPDGTRAKTIGLYHGLGNAVVVILFLVSWLLRRDAPTIPDTLAVTLSVVGLVLGLVTAWLGGELVDRLGVGVDTGAHLDALSSLSGRPAGERAAHSARRDGGA